MVVRALALLLTLLVFVPTAIAQTNAEPRTAVTQLLHAHQVSNWSKVAVVEFTWKHKSGKARSYVWNVKLNTVVVTTDGETVKIPMSGKGLKSKAEVAAHKAFINDSYWMLFEFHIDWDDVQITDLGKANSPLGGKAQAFRVQYPEEGGYTPGDAYVVFVGEDGKSMAWKYFPGGGADARVTTTRGGYTPAGPLVLPTRFETTDGELVIEITDLTVRSR